MAWPAGQQNGGRPYREVRATETNIPPGTTIAASVGSQFQFDWGTGGYTNGRFSLDVNMSAPNTLSILGGGYDSEGNANTLTQDPLVPLILPTLSLLVGDNRIILAWDDGAWPGSWLLSNSAGLFQGALTSNPVWAKNYALGVLELLNGSGAGIITVTDFEVALRG
jgi:hypothetical protein